jgi:hypothetical protein
LRITLVNPQFRAIACPDNVASKLGEPDHVSSPRIFRVVQCIYCGRGR